MHQGNRPGAVPAVIALALVACAPRFASPEPAALVLSDGAEVRFDEALRIAIVGAGGPPDTVADIAAWEPDVVLLVGDQVDPSTRREWRDARERWGPLWSRVVLVPGQGEHRADGDLKGLRAAFPGAGVRALGAGWWHVDLVQPGARWRVVLLDVGSKRTADQAFWLPKVLAGEGYDQLLLVAGQPLEGEADRLWSIARDTTGPTALLAVVVGGVDTHAITLPEGPYGHAWLEVGPAEQGWWPARIDGDSLELAWREVRGASADESTRIRSSPASGWSAVAEPATVEPTSVDAPESAPGSPAP